MNSLRNTLAETHITAQINAASMFFIDSKRDNSKTYSQQKRKHGAFTSRHCCDPANDQEIICLEVFLDIGMCLPPS